MSERRFAMSQVAFVVACALLGAGLLAGCKGAAHEGEPEEGEGVKPTVLVTIVAVVRGPMRDLVETAGTLGPVLGSEARVAAQVAGTVVRVRAEEGKLVHAGDAVLELDPAPLAAEESGRGAELRSAQAAAALAAGRFDRAQALEARGIAAGKDVAEAKAASDQAAEDVKRADSALAAARLGRERTVVRSPIAGTVLRRDVSPGQFVAAETVVFSVAPTGRLEVEAVAPASTAARVRIGQEAAVSCANAADAILAGRVSFVAPSLDSESGTARLRVAVANADRALRPGLFCRARIAVEEHPQALIVPLSAVVVSEGQATLAVVGQDSVAHLRKVKTGIREGDRIEVSEGVSEGERVVAEGAYGLADATPVRTE